MLILLFAGLFLSGFLTGLLAFWLRWRFQRNRLSIFRRRRHSLRHRQDYMVRISGRARRQLRVLGRHYGPRPRLDLSRF